jgi:DNA-binding NtrC family response regulator
MRILVIDDEAGFRQMMTEWLQKQGYDACDISDGPEVLDLLKKNHFDVVILDLVMPKANGLTLISEIHRLCPQTRMIVVSAAADVRVAVEAARAGAETCLEKPVEFDVLRSELQRLQQMSDSESAAPGLGLHWELAIRVRGWSHA